MSIVKMKHIRLFGMAADRETLLRQLQHLGCVEISEPTDKLADPDWAALTRVDDAGLARVKADAALLNAALNTLKGIGKEKGGLLQARPEVTEGQLFDEGLRASAMEAAQAVNAQEKRISAIQNEQGKLRAQKAALTPWLELDIPLETTGTREVSATRSYPNLASQDTASIPKSIEEDGRTLTLQNIDWRTDNTASVAGYNLGDCYTAVATYTGTATSSYVTGYTVTADYTGTVSRIALNRVRYVAIFEGEPLEPAVPMEESGDGLAQFNWAAILLPLGVVFAVGGVIGACLFVKRRRENKEDSE